MASQRLLACHKWLSGAATIALLLCLFVPLSSSSSSTSSRYQKGPQIFTVEVVNEYPHDPNAFTEGLLYGENNTLYESTGLYGESSVRRVDLLTGKVEALQEMSKTYFGEGLTLIGERLYQLTYQEQVGFIYDRSNLSKVGKFNHQMNDGWGLTTDGKFLFGSDGSSTLYQIDAQTMKEIRRLTVRDENNEVYYLNELEYVSGEVWANFFPTDCIVRISPEDGTVLGWILLSNLRERFEAAGEIYTFGVLNGIAWDNDQERIFVTGKHWPKLFEIKVHELNDPSRVDIQQLCKPWFSSSHMEG